MAINVFGKKSIDSLFLLNKPPVEVNGSIPYSLFLNNLNEHQIVAVQGSGLLWASQISAPRINSNIVHSFTFNLYIDGELRFSKTIPPLQKLSFNKYMNEVISGGVGTSTFSGSIYFGNFPFVIPFKEELKLTAKINTSISSVYTPTNGRLSFLIVEE